VKHFKKGSCIFQKLREIIVKHFKVNYFLLHLYSYNAIRLAVCFLHRSRTGSRTDARGRSNQTSNSVPPSTHHRRPHRAVSVGPHPKTTLPRHHSSTRTQLPSSMTGTRTINSELDAILNPTCLVRFETEALRDSSLLWAPSFLCMYVCM